VEWRINHTRASAHTENEIQQQQQVDPPLAYPEAGGIPKKVFVGEFSDLLAIRVARCVHRDIWFVGLHVGFFCGYKTKAAGFGVSHHITAVQQPKIIPVSLFQLQHPSLPSDWSSEKPRASPQAGRKSNNTRVRFVQ
jgi:hypothetical protein